MKSHMLQISCLFNFQLKKKDAKSKLDEIGALFKPVQEQKISAGKYLSSLIPEASLWLVLETYKHLARFSDRWWRHGRLGQRKAGVELLLLLLLLLSSSSSSLLLLLFSSLLSISFSL